MKGNLLKRSPSSLRVLNPWDARYVTVEDGKLSWFLSPESAEPQGFLDLRSNDIIVQEADDEGTLFSICPRSNWESGRFTGMSSKRILEFDSKDSAYKRDAWIAALNLEMKASPAADPIVDSAVAAATDAANRLKEVLQCKSKPPHFGPDALLESIASGAIAPLRGRWLVELHKNGGKLKRRQDLPSEAFFNIDELRILVTEFGDDYGLLFVALSYRWLSQAHPDPTGFHLATVARAAELYMNEDEEVSPLPAAFVSKGLGEVDFALFWDFGSLFQNPRSPAEQVLFVPGLKASNVWYGHEHSVCWMLTALPPDFSFAPHLAQTYEESGWCFVEAAISAGVKLGPRRLDLAKWSRDVYAYSGHWPPHERLDLVCAGQRLPPLIPDEVKRLLETEKKFTSGADVEIVDMLYRAFFRGITSASRLLDFSGLAWCDDEALLLAKSLLHFSSLTSLDLSRNKISGSAVNAIAEFVTTSTTLSNLDTRGNNIIGKGAQELAAAVLSSNAMLTFGGIPMKELRENNLKSLDLSSLAVGFGMGPPPRGPAEAHVVAKLVGINTSLIEINMSYNEVGDEGWCAIFDALRSNPGNTVANLELMDNALNVKVAKSLTAYIAASGSSLTSLDISSNRICDVWEEGEEEEDLEEVGTYNCEGIEALADVLRTNTRLTYLNVANNRLDEKAETLLRDYAAPRGVGLGL